MNRPISLALRAGTITGVVLCAAATAAHALGLPSAPGLARMGVLAIFVTPPLRLAVTASAFFARGEPRYGLAATAVLLALLGAAIHAALW